MSFVPSTHLPALHTRKVGRCARFEEIEIGLDEIARALGVLEDEEEHYFLGEGEASGSTSNLDDTVTQDGAEEEEDAFELRHVKDWLTSVSCLRWLPLTGQGDAGGENDPEDDGKVDEILRKTSRLLAICAGKSGES
jgi:hypothetical protein